MNAGKQVQRKLAVDGEVDKASPGDDGSRSTSRSMTKAQQMLAVNGVVGEKESPADAGR